MKVDIEVTVDVQDVFDELDQSDQSTFILSNIDCVDTDDLVKELEDRGIYIDTND